MERGVCGSRVGWKRPTWTPEEDEKLRASMEVNGLDTWNSIAENAGIQRSGRSCRLRWMNFLRQGIKQGKFSLQEQQTVIQLHAQLGNRWTDIAAHLPNRTASQIKNYWKTSIRKRLMLEMGINPDTHILPSEARE